MISKYIFIVLALCCAGCGGATPSAAPLKSTLPTPTAIGAPVLTATPAPSATPVRLKGAEFFLPAQEKLDAYLNGNGDVGAVYNTFARGAVRFLKGRISADEALQDHAVVDELESILKAMRLRERITPRVIVIPLRDEIGERGDLLCFSFVEAQGVPIVILWRRGSTITPFPLETLGSFQVEGKRWAWLREFTAVDVTGDGIDELVWSYIHAGASYGREELHITRWDADTGALKDIFRGNLVTWAGESAHSFLVAEKGDQLQVSFPWFGAFSAKMMDHLTATEVWSYDAVSDTMTRRTRTVQAPRSVRHQVNIAEILFRNGDLEGALRAFDRAATDFNLIEEEFIVVHATRAFAQFRQGHLAALLGRETEARAYLSQAEQAGGTLAAVVKAFRKNYRGENAALRAWAMLPREIDLAAELYKGDGESNIDLPATANEIFFQGGVIAAYLNQHSAKEQGLRARLQELGALGFQWRDALELDWDGDGQQELLVVTHEGEEVNDVHILWLVYHKEGRWRARNILTSWNVQELKLLETLTLPNTSGQAITVTWREDQRREQRLAWDGARLLQLDLQTLEPLPLEENEFVVGWLPEEIEF